jgi:AraC-like DNA-binding protein/mannose-6-phosphate isomerase-like protein (cupin superfamily)
MPTEKKISDGFKGQKIIVLPNEALTHCVSNTLINGLYITRIGIFPNAANHFKKRPHGLTKLIVFIHCIDGEGWIKIQDKVITLKMGEAFFIPTGITHSYGASKNKPWSIYWMHIAGNKKNDLIHLCNQKSDHDIIKVVYSEERMTLFHQIMEIFSKGFSLSNLQLANLILPHYLGTFLSADSFNGLSAESYGEDNMVNDAIKFMQQNLNRQVTIEDMAKHVGKSSSFFFKKFKKDTGYSPIAYFNFLKIQLACQFIHAHTLTISEIGTKIGIDDPYYFSRLFKKLMGVSPRQYRNNLFN